MKIGVLTFHRCINYGSYWQARCLADGLRAPGHDVVILDHASRRVDRAEWKCALQPTLPIPTSASDRLAYRRKIARFFEAFEALPLSPRFPIDDPSGIDDLDLLVVGSDEVWNLTHPWYGRCPIFYGQDISARRMVSYAASFGHHAAERGLPSPWSNWLRRFDRISVRDEVSRTIIEQATGISPDVVLDPCLQFPLAHESCPDIAPDRPFVAVYGQGFSAAFADGILRWAGRHGLQLTSVGYRNDWADEQRLDAGPCEFAQLIEHASAVATNFFHGCVFSLCNGKPFACESSWYRSNKLRCLMTQIGDERRLLHEDADAQAFDGALGHPLDTDVGDRIRCLRESSQRVLDDMLATEAAAS